MYYYEFGYTSCEDSGIIMMMHKRSFKKHQFNKMIYDCSLDVARMYFAKEREVYKEIREDESDYSSPRRKYAYEDEHITITFTDIYKEVAELMCERYGFDIPKAKQSWLAFGWANLRKKDDWKDYGDNAGLQNKISRAIIKELGKYEDTHVAYEKWKAEQETTKID